MGRIYDPVMSGDEVVQVVDDAPARGFDADGSPVPVESAPDPAGGDRIGGDRRRWWLPLLLLVILVAGVVLLFMWGASASAGGGCGGG